MTPQPQHGAAVTRSPLQLVAAPEFASDDEWLTAGAGDADRRAQRVIDQWAPEHQLIGTLMWLPAERARPLVELVPATAIWQPQARWAYEVIAALVDSGQAPTPVAVLHRARVQPATADLPPGVGNPQQVVATAGRPRLHRLALYLFDAYSQSVSPAAAGTYAREVLDDAYRRAVGAAGIRMQQLAETCVHPAELTEQLCAIRDELTELRRRADTASTPGRPRP